MLLLKAILLIINPNVFGVQQKQQNEFALLFQYFRRESYMASYVYS